MKRLLLPLTSLLFLLPPTYALAQDFSSTRERGDARAELRRDRSADYGERSERGRQSNQGNGGQYASERSGGSRHGGDRSDHGQYRGDGDRYGPMGGVAQHDYDRGSDRSRHGGDRRDHRVDSRWDRGDHRNGRWDRGRDHHRWDRDNRWDRDRRDHRWQSHDWRRSWHHGWRGTRYHAPARYYYPSGYSYRSWRIGHYLPRVFLSSAYYIDYHPYGIAAPPYGYRWVRVDHDLLLVELISGEIVDILFSFYW